MYRCWSLIVTHSWHLNEINVQLFGLSCFSSWRLLCIWSKCHCMVCSLQRLQVSHDVKNTFFFFGWYWDLFIYFTHSRLMTSHVCLHECVWGKDSFSGVNPFFLVAVPGPPSCFSPHTVTIFLLLHPLVTQACIHNPSNPSDCLQRASRFYEQSGHTCRTHTSTHLDTLWIPITLCNMLPSEGSSVSLGLISVHG